MSYILYASEGTGSAVCEAVLALTGIAHRRIDVKINSSEGPDPELVTVNPLGQVPVLKMPSGEILTESAAIVLYLADLVPEKGLAPLPSDPSRARYLRWMAFLASAIYPSELRKYYPERYTSDPAGAEAVRDAAITRLTREFAVLAAGLGTAPYILGDKLSAVDIYAAMMVGWEENQEGMRDVFPGLIQLGQRVAAHPLIRPIWERNSLPT